MLLRGTAAGMEIALRAAGGAARTVCIALAMLATLAPAASAQVVEYVGGIEVGLNLGRIVADPVRGQVYGVTGDGDVVFMDRESMSVTKVIQTGRQLRDIDVDPQGRFLTVLDNVTGAYWSQPPSVYVLEFDPVSQSRTNITLVQAPLYQMALGRPGRVAGVAVNQWVHAYLCDLETGERLDQLNAGYYGGSQWNTQTLVASNDGQTLYRTEVGISSISLISWDMSTDRLIRTGVRGVGSYGTVPLFINATDTSLYVGGVRLNPLDISQVLGVFPETIWAATGDDRFAFGTTGVYDPQWGDLLETLPVPLTALTAIGENDRYLYTFQGGTLHVMHVIPEPSTLVLLGLGGLGAIVRRRMQVTG